MMTLEPPRSMVPGAADLSQGEVWQALGLSRAGLGRFLRVAQEAVGLRGEVSVLLSDDRALRKLNREWRGKDKATDVLSFPAYSSAPAMEEMAGVHAGDLAVSLETAKRQAKEQRHELRDEVRVLLLHGLLHLTGMDHEVDGGEMAAREAELRAKLRMKSGLIARSTGVRGQGSGIREPLIKSAAFPSGAKAPLQGGHLTDGLKPVPFKARLNQSLLRQSEGKSKSSHAKGAKLEREGRKVKTTAKTRSRFPAGMTARRPTAKGNAKVAA